MLSRPRLLKVRGGTQVVRRRETNGLMEGSQLRNQKPGFRGIEAQGPSMRMRKLKILASPSFPHLARNLHPSIPPCFMLAPSSTR